MRYNELNRRPYDFSFSFRNSDTHVSIDPCEKKFPGWKATAERFPELEHLEITNHNYRDESVRVLDDDFYQYMAHLKGITVHTLCQGLDERLVNFKQLELLKIDLNNYGDDQPFALPEHFATHLSQLTQLKALELTLYHVKMADFPFTLSTESKLDYLNLKICSETETKVNLDLYAQKAIEYLAIDVGDNAKLETLQLPANIDYLALTSPTLSTSLNASDVEVIHAMKLDSQDAALIEVLLNRDRGQQCLALDIPADANTNNWSLFEAVTEINWNAYKYETQAFAELGFLAKFPQLETLNLSICSEKALSQLCLCPKLSCLRLDAARQFRNGDLFGESVVIEQLPDSFFELKALETLYLTDLNIHNFAGFSQLSQLQKLYYSSSHMLVERGEDFTDLMQAPALTELFLHSSGYVDGWRFTPEGLFNARPDLNIDFEIKDGERKNEEFSKQFAVLYNSNLTIEQKNAYLPHLMATDMPKHLPPMDSRFYLTFMEAKYSKFKAHYTTWLDARSDADLAKRPLDSSAVIFVCGTLGLKAKELKEKVSESGLTLSAKLTDKVTHIVLGRNPKNTAQIDADNALIINENALTAYFDKQQPAFLQQEDAQDSMMVDNVVELLKSDDNANHQLALELIKQGGITEPVIMPLFCVLKLTSDATIRKKAKDLLSGYVTGSMKDAVLDRTLFNTVLTPDHWERKRPDEGPFLKKIKTASKKWGLPLSFDFCLDFYERHQFGLLFLLMQKESSPQLRIAVDALFKDGTLDWSRGCGFNLQIENISQEGLVNIICHPDIYLKDISMPQKIRTVLPAYLPQEQKVTSLNLSNCFMGNDLPRGIEHYKDVTHLDCSLNHIDTLPKAITKLKKLTELNLSRNHFTEVPAILAQLPNLKRLDLTENYHWRGEKTEFLKAELEQILPNCEILV